MALLGDIDAGFAPSRLKRDTPAPVRAPVDYQVDGRARHGDLYLPPQGARGGLVLVPGVTPAALVILLRHVKRASRAGGSRSGEAAA